VKAVTLSSYGGPEALGWGDVPDPQPAPGEVVVEVVASAVNRADVMQRMGFYPPPPGASEVLGLECSGTIAAVGAEVSGWAVGDAVCALLPGGGYAERVAVAATQLLPVPAGCDVVTAAALPEVTCTVWSNLVMVAGLRAGETLLVHGGSSGVGTMAIQVAKQLGATVLCTAGSPEKLERCRELGADVAIDYRGEDFVEVARAATDGRGVDVVLDNMGAKYLARNVEVLAAGGRLVVIGLQGGRRAELDLGTLLAKRGAVHATSLRYSPPDRKAEIVAGVRRKVWPMLERGAVKPVVHATFPMPDAADAHRLLESSTHVGKILLTVPR
jgi:putative PIG3 family NAD(P)H quinone oxidoreductase